MKLVICEKPKVAEKIAYALGKGKAQKKSLYGAPYYEVERDGERLVVVSAVGHLYTLQQSKGPRGYPVYDVEWVPTHKAEKGADFSEKYLKTIMELAPGAEEYVCACDYDIEGSLIGYNVIRFLGDEKKGSRMKFSALTDDELQEAFEARERLDVKNALAGEARHKLDWFYGINLSRALMASIRSAGAGYSQTMSIGRVQGPALAIVVKKEKEISAFTPVPYWEVKCRIKDAEFSHVKGRFLKKEEAERALANTKKEGKISKIERKEYAQAAPPPFDLTSLQVEAYRLFNFAPARTLEYAQALYEASLISYPRTSSQKLPPKLNLKKIIEALSKNPVYEKSALSLLSKGRTAPLEGKKEDEAHPAIHPTGMVMKGQVGEKEGRLYDLVAKRFLACFGESAMRETQRIEAMAGEEPYAVSGSRTVKNGWFDIYAPYVKLEEASLPQFSEGEAVQVKDAAMAEKKTQPPKRYTAASIISELERLHLGTKATRAAVVETLFKRGYLDGTSIRATPFGMAVYGLLSGVAPEILDEELTRGIEDEMEKIQDGENEKKAVEGGKRVLDSILKKFDGKEREIGFSLLSGLRQKEHAESSLGKCVRCGGGLRALRSRAGKQFAGCENYPKCTATYPLPQDAKIVPLGKACEKCGTPMVRVLRKARKPFEMCLDPNCETKKYWGRGNPSAAPAALAKPKADVSVGVGETKAKTAEKLDGPIAQGSGGLGGNVDIGKVPAPKEKKGLANSPAKPKKAKAAKKAIKNEPMPIHEEGKNG